MFEKQEYIVNGNHISQPETTSSTRSTSKASLLIFDFFSGMHKEESKLRRAVKLGEKEGYLYICRLRALV